MVNLIKSCAAVVLSYCLFTSSTASAQNVWTAGFPKKDPMIAGNVLVNGTCTPSAGFTLTGGGAISYWPAAGGVVQTVPMVVNRTTGKWSLIHIELRRRCSNQRACPGNGKNGDDGAAGMRRRQRW